MVESPGVNAEGGPSSYRSLLGNLRAHIRTYVAKQLLLPRQEVQELIAANMRAVVLMLVGAILLFLFLMQLLAFAVAMLVVSGYWWLAVLLVLLPLLLGGIVLLVLGKNRLALRGPERSIRSMKETVSWVKATLLGRSES